MWSRILLLNEATTVDLILYAHCKKALSGLILLAFQFSPFACSLYSCILCISCICFVFVPCSYATCEWPEFYVNKVMFCSVLFSSFFWFMFSSSLGNWPFKNEIVNTLDIQQVLRFEFQQFRIFEIWTFTHVIGLMIHYCTLVVILVAFILR